jgi:hypothetical protein
LLAGDVLLNHRRMKMSEHTPGPWLKNSGMLYGSNGSPVVAAGLGLGLGGDNGDGVRNANALLIAAAPELLEALKDALCALECCGKDYPAEAKARAAIAKVEGKQ